jgi:hypothetical protein
VGAVLQHGDSGLDGHRCCCIICSWASTSSADPTLSASENVDAKLNAWKYRANHRRKTCTSRKPVKEYKQRGKHMPILLRKHISNKQNCYSSTKLRNGEHNQKEMLLQILIGVLLHQTIASKESIINRESTESN